MNLKKILIAIYIPLFCWSLFEKFVTISSQIYLYTNEVKGTSIVMISAIFFVYAIFTNKQILKYLSSIFMIIGYIYTFSTVNKVYDDTITLEIGFYLYLFSFIAFLLTFIFNGKQSNTDMVKNSKNNFNNNDGLKEENYIIGNYLYGIKKPEFSNHSCAITTSKDKKDMIIILTSIESYKIEIKQEDIKSINVKKGVLMRNSNMPIEDHGFENSLLATALVGVWGPVISQSVGNLSSGEKIKYHDAYTVEIVYTNDNEEFKIVIEVFKNPDSFLKMFGEKYKKILG